MDVKQHIQTADILLLLANVLLSMLTGKVLTEYQFQLLFSEEEEIPLYLSYMKLLIGNMEFLWEVLYPLNKLPLLKVNWEKSEEIHLPCSLSVVTIWEITLITGLNSESFWATTVQRSSMSIGSEETTKGNHIMLTLISYILL